MCVHKTKTCGRAQTVSASDSWQKCIRRLAQDQATRTTNRRVLNSAPNQLFQASINRKNCKLPLRYVHWHNHLQTRIKNLCNAAFVANALSPPSDTTLLLFQTLFILPAHLVYTYNTTTSNRPLAVLVLEAIKTSLV